MLQGVAKHRRIYCVSDHTPLYHEDFTTAVSIVMVLVLARFFFPSIFRLSPIYSLNSACFSVNSSCCHIIIFKSHILDISKQVSPFSAQDHIHLFLYTYTAMLVVVVIIVSKSSMNVRGKWFYCNEEWCTGILDSTNTTSRQSSLMPARYRSHAGESRTFPTCLDNRLNMSACL